VCSAAFSPSSFPPSLSTLAAPSGVAAAEEGQGAVNALGMDSSFDSFDANRFEILDGLNDAGRVAIASAYDWDGGRVESDDSGRRINCHGGMPPIRALNHFPSYYFNLIYNGSPWGV
jgi:hypothetical protein